jgi:hypothetical protein
MTSRVFIPTRDTIDDAALEQIYRSLLTFHDLVYIRSSAAQPHQLGASVIAELRDAGLVQLLGLESDPTTVIRASDVVLPGDVHIHIANSIDEATSYRPYIPSDGLTDPERTSRIVERRVTLWNVSLATHLAADLGHFTPRPLLTEKAIQAEGTRLGLQLDVSDLLFAVFRVASVSGLSVEELVRLRKNLPKVRRQIRQLVDAHALRSSDPDERQQSLVAIEDNIYELQDQVLDSLAKSRGVQGRIRTGAGLMLDVVGLFFYQVSFVGMFGDVAEFLWDARKDRLVLYMHSISRTPAIEAGRRNRLLERAPTVRLLEMPEHNAVEKSI